MELNEFPLKIGRVTRAVEVALNLSLASDVHVYMRKEDVEALIAARPNGYLAMLSEVSEALKKPDFVSFDAKAKRFYYIRFYFQGVHLKAACILIRQLGEPRKWHYEKMSAISLAQLEELERAHPLARPSK